MIAGLLKSKREKTRLETLAFLRDTLEGRPAQNVRLSGGLAVAHWTPGMYAHLTDEEVAILAKLHDRHAKGALPDGLQNQTESKPAIEAEVIESETVQPAEMPTY